MRQNKVSMTKNLSFWAFCKKAKNPHFKGTNLRFEFVDTSLRSVWQGNTSRYDKEFVILSLLQKKAKNPHFKGTNLHFEFMDTSLRSVWQKKHSVWQEINQYDRKMAHYDNKIKAVWQGLRGLCFVVLAVENLGVKLKFWLFGLSCKVYVLLVRRLESVFVFCLVMINKNTL